MTQGSVVLEGLERDALTEIVNIGVSRAAVSLRKMVGEQVVLSVPSVELLTYAGAATLLHERERGKLVAVKQDFSGAFNGWALLIFPQTSRKDLVKAVAGGELSDDELDQMEEETITETGNIVLSGCLSSMANMLSRPLTLSLPQILRGDGQVLFAPAETVVRTDEDVVLVVHINFLISEQNIRGYIAMVMDLLSLDALKRLVGEFVQRIIGDEGSGHPI